MEKERTRRVAVVRTKCSDTMRLVYPLLTISTAHAFTGTHTHTAKRNVRSVLHYMLHDTHTHTDTCTEESKRTRRERSMQNARPTDQARGTQGSFLPRSPPIFWTPRSPLCRAEAESRPRWASRPSLFLLCGAQVHGCSHVSNGA